jgi:hypothetical protein
VVSAKLPIVGGMASMPSRIDSLRIALPRILPQVDRLYLYLDKYDEVPAEFRKLSKVTCILPTPGSKPIGCSGKFVGLQLFKDECAYFTFDDDIVYPAGYTQHMMRALARTFFKSVVAVHGVQFTMPFKSYSRSRRQLHFRRGLEMDVLVDEVGTGTAAFHSGLLKVNPARWAHANMSDLNFMLECIGHGVPRVCVARPPGFLKPIGELQDDSVFVAMTRDDSRETAILQAAIARHPAYWER